MVGFSVVPAKRLRLDIGAHQFFLRTVNDALYSAGGGIVALNRDATSRSIGSEVDVFSTYTVSKELKIQGGLSVFNSGAFLKESICGGTIWKPYVMWITNF